MEEEVKKALIELIQAINNGDLDKVIQCLAVPGINVNIGYNYRFRRALNLAVNRGHLDIVKRLISAGAKLNSRDADDFSPLETSIDNGHIDIVKELIKAGADINATDNNGYTPLFLAIERNDLNILKELINAGANVNISSKKGWTPLMYACNKENIEYAKLLLENGANPDILNGNKESLLLLNANKGNTDMSKLLLQFHADPNIESDNGATPLTQSARNGYIEIVKMLLDYRANPNSKDRTGWSALMYSTRHANIDIAKILLEKGANPNIQEPINGATPLMRGVWKKNINLIKLLLNDDRTQQNIVENNGLTAYLLAAIQGYVEGIQAFHEDTAIAYGSLEGPIEFIPPPNVEPSTLMEGKTNRGMIDIFDDTFDIFTQDPITEGQLIVRVHQINDDFFLLDEWTTYINKYSSRNKSNQVINPANRQPVKPDQIDIFTAHIVPKKDEDPIHISKYHTNGGYRHGTRKRRRR